MPGRRERLTLKLALPVPAERAYRAWMSAKEHAAFTGGPAVIRARIGAAHAAWDGYITGRILAVEPGRHAAMTWRTTDFAETDPDSVLEVHFVPKPRGCELKLVHTGLPRGGRKTYGEGWEEYYFEPLRRYFAPKPKKTPAKRA